MKKRIQGLTFLQLELHHPIKPYSFALVLWFLVHGEDPLNDTTPQDLFKAADEHLSLRPPVDRVTFAPLVPLMQQVCLALLMRASSRKHIHTAEPP